MKKIKIAQCIAVALSLAFLSCKIEEEEEETYRVELPSSVGENELVGSKWEIFDKNNLVMKSWVFDDGMATYKEDHRDKKDNSKSVIPTKTFFYSYTTNSSEKLLYLRLEKVEQIDGKGTNTWSNGEEYWEEYFRKNGTTQTNALLDYWIEGEDAKFYEQAVYSYKISSSKITLTRFFTGSLPTGALFATSGEETSIKVQSAGIFIDGNGVTVGYGLYPRFEGKNFAGNLYKFENLTYSVVGEIGGFYESEAKGKSGSLLYLTFTSLPDGVSEIEVNKAYCLKQKGSVYVFNRGEEVK